MQGMSWESGLLLLLQSWGMKGEVLGECKCSNKAKRYLLKQEEFVMEAIRLDSVFIYDITYACLGCFMKHKAKGNASENL